MPLPAYMLEQPKTNPTAVLARQIKNLGVDVDLVRNGNTLTVRNFDPNLDNEDRTSRALRLITTHADTNGLSIDAIVLSIEANMISRYEAAGFMMHVTPNEDSDESEALLHRPARN